MSKSVMVPVEPTEEMWGGIARQMIMWLRMPNPTGHELHLHLKRAWHEPMPEWLAKEIPDTDHVPPKGTVAACIFKAMIEPYRVSFPPNL